MRQILLLFIFITVHADTFSLFSTDLQGQLLKEQVLNGFGCNGKNISPQLRWKNPPKGTKSYALTMYDPDAPTGSGWWHWILINIPATVYMIERNASASKNLPNGTLEIVNDFGTSRYMGACPPKNSDAHRYIFTLYALDIPKLNIPTNATNALVRYLIHRHTISKASIITYYKRQ